MTAATAPPCGHRHQRIAAMCMPALQALAVEAVEQSIRDVRHRQEATMTKLTLPQIELVAAAAGRKLWRHQDQDYTVGTHGHQQVTKRVAVLYSRNLLVRGEDRNLGWLWRPTETARAEALAELDGLRDRLTWLRRDLDPTAGEDDA